MGPEDRSNGPCRNSKKGWKTRLIKLTLLGNLSLSALFCLAPAAMSGGETRSLSMQQVHTGEELTITYMVGGRYIPSALSKINYFMRDWRSKKVIRIDPRTIDLMWELHADLGSKAPIHIICGYRTSGTNGLLRRIGRNVAENSQHIRGRAIDLFFPDVPTVKIRNSALVRQVGGVGYYRTSGGPTGFVHIDSGSVRHWGPFISHQQMASIFQQYRRTVGARLNRTDQRTAVAMAEQTNRADFASKAFTGKSFTKSVAKPIEAAYEDDDEEFAALSAQASRRPMPVVPVNINTEMAIASAPSTISMNALTANIPMPRTKPIEILMMASSQMLFTPASAPPPNGQATRFRARPSTEQDSVVDRGEIAALLAQDEQIANPSGKGNFVENVNIATNMKRSTTHPVEANAAGFGAFSWPEEKTERPSGRGNKKKTGKPEVALKAPSALENNQITQNTDSKNFNDHAAAKGDLIGNIVLTPDNALTQDGKGDFGADLSQFTKTQP